MMEGTLRAKFQVPIIEALKQEWNPFAQSKGDSKQNESIWSSLQQLV